ncbi:MMPL family transporter [Kribbella sp. NPDC050470]|uniref:MMPL family transporter n=1 Tax=unclassified Kribbella TaxID=2644121 RepID=UPI00379F3620
MNSFVRFVLRHGRLVALAWLVVLLVGGATAGQLNQRLSIDYSLPGQPGYEAEKQLEQTYGTNSSSPFISVVTVPKGSTVEGEKARVGDVYEAIRQQVPGVRVVDFASTNDPRFLTNDGRSTFGLVFMPLPSGFGSSLEAEISAAADAAAERSGLEAGLTSYEMLAGGGDSDGPSVLVETLLGGLGALAVLIFVFASFLALVPLIIATVSILSTFLVVLGLTTFTDVSFVVEFLIALVGLGVAIDYSLLIVSRWREERAHGQENSTAVVTAMRTAGHAVIASGITVAISLVALIVVPVPLLRSMGIGGLLIPLVSVLVCFTLLPALLAGIGPRVDRPRIRKEAVASRGWTAWARLIVRHRWLAAATSLAVLGVLVAPVFGIAIGQARADSLARSGSSFETLQVLRDGGVGTGVLTPIEVLVPADQADAAARAASAVDGVHAAVVGGTSDGRAVVEVLPRNETVDSTGTAVVDRVRDAVEDAVDGPVGVTGSGATVEDYFHAVYENFPYVLGLIALITYILLVRTFRSLLLPLKAVILNLISVAAVFGAVVYFWQQGHGSDAVFDVSGTGAVTFWLPPLIFGFLFGLSMDYEVFILSRMREEYDATGSTRQAVTVGLGRTGRLVTSAALILFCAFAALASAPGTDIKVFATALGVGILIDATIVRALLVPALVSVLGRWNWWLPEWPARLLRIEPSPLATKGVVAPPGRREPAAGRVEEEVEETHQPALD